MAMQRCVLLLLSVLLLMPTLSPDLLLLVLGDASLPYWGSITQAECVFPGLRKYYARLWNAQDWLLDCKLLPATVNDKKYTPDKCVDKGVGGMWAEWYLRDKSCDLWWDPFKKDHCTGPGLRQISAVLNGIPNKSQWKDWCPLMAVVFDDIYYPSPHRCVVPLAEFHVWGEVDVPDPTCCDNEVSPADKLRRRMLTNTGICFPMPTPFDNLSPPPPLSLQSPPNDGRAQALDILNIFRGVNENIFLLTAFQMWRVFARHFRYVMIHQNNQSAIRNLTVHVGPAPDLRIFIRDRNGAQPPTSQQQLGVQGFVVGETPAHLLFNNGGQISFPIASITQAGYTVFDLTATQVVPGIDSLAPIIIMPPLIANVAVIVNDRETNRVYMAVASTSSLIPDVASSLQLFNVFDRVTPETVQGMFRGVHLQAPFIVVVSRHNYRIFSGHGTIVSVIMFVRDAVLYMVLQLLDERGHVVQTRRARFPEESPLLLSAPPPPSPRDELR